MGICALLHDAGILTAAWSARNWWWRSPSRRPRRNPAHRWTRPEWS